MFQHSCQECFAGDFTCHEGGCRCMCTNSKYKLDKFCRFGGESGEFS